MRLFPRKKEALDAVPPDDAPFQAQALRRSPRNTRKPRPLADNEVEPAAPIDPAQTSKTRARRRLIGAIALALVAIVFVPMLFDRTAVAPPDDISLQIPDRNSPFEGRRGVPDPGKGPLKPSTELPPTLSGPAPSASEATASSAPDAVAAAATEKPATAAPPKPAIASPRAADKPSTAAEKADKAEKAEKADRAAERPKPATAMPSSDDPRAVAALEGRSETPAAADAANKSYAVQIAAFSAPDKARGLRDQLVASGLKSYTESVATPQGVRTRVRLGPFASRDAADRAKQKLRAMKLDGSVVAL